MTQNWLITSNGTNTPAKAHTVAIQVATQKSLSLSYLRENILSYTSTQIMSCLPLTGNRPLKERSHVTKFSPIFSPLIRPDIRPDISLTLCQ